MAHSLSGSIGATLTHIHQIASELDAVLHPQRFDDTRVRIRYSLLRIRSLATHRLGQVHRRLNKESHVDIQILGAALVVVINALQESQQRR